MSRTTNCVVTSRRAETIDVLDLEKHHVVLPKASGQEQRPDCPYICNMYLNQNQKTLPQLDDIIEPAHNRL